MESKHTGPGHRDESRVADPTSDLALLERAKSSIEEDQILDFGPWWYAPLIATLIAGVTLWGQETDGGWNLVAGVVGLLSGGAVAIHDHRRRMVRPRKTVRGAALLAPVVVLTFATMAAWGTAVSTLGYDRFVPGYAVLGWVLTSLVLLGARTLLLTIRRRRIALL